MALETYHEKRNFKVSPEPRGKVSHPAKGKTGGNSFVIQKHDATRLHYDFRLEMDGVLKSWAVTRGPSLSPGEKRLAVHVEDHPLDYGGFEGMIPKGNYGAGAVLLWDRGTWEPIGDPHKAYKKGHMEFELKGEKLEGRWHLVRMGHKEGEKRENWLLIKGEDEFAREENGKDILDELPLSVKTGKTLDEIWGRKPATEKRAVKASAQTAPAGKTTSIRKAAARHNPEPEKADIQVSKIKGAKKAALPDFVDPQLATLVKAAPSGKRWVHEIKLDGYRIQAHIEDGKVTLLTRTGLDWTAKFGKDIVATLEKLGLQNAIIDGEIAVEAGSGATDFSLLQLDLSEGCDDRFTFFAFDLIHLDGYDLTGATLLKRKEALETLLKGSGPVVRYSEHFPDEGGLVLKHACRLSLEGIISKISDAPYRSGRNRDWVKSKCSARQEFVVAGYVRSSVNAKAIGSLVMGYHEKGKLRHAGRVGTGYSSKVAQSLFKDLDAIRIETSPFDEKLVGVEKKDVVFVKPEKVAEVEFLGWTADAHIRHAAFRGLREDKDPKDIVREGVPVTAADQPNPPKRTVNLTHPDRVYWPDVGVTKAGLADYYTEVWRLMAPFVVNRPLALLRGPDGIDKQLFFQKHAWKGMTNKAVLVKDPADPADEYITIRNLDGLLGLVQGATLEVHPWGSNLDDLEKPDMVNIDLDPGEGVSWTEIIAAAHEVKRRVEDMGLVAYVKTSGGKGLHVVAPVKPKAEWPEVKAAMKALADGMAGDTPEKYVSTITKSKRKGKILIDYLRNGRGNTAVAPYSTRARPGAAVSMPIEWDELGGAIGPNYFTVMNTPARIAGWERDPWADFRKAEAVLTFKEKKRR